MLKKSIAVATILLVAGGAFASTIYDNEGDFLAEVQPGYYLEDFGTPTTSDLAPSSFTDGTYTWSATSADDLFVWGEEDAPPLCVGSLGTNSPSYTVTVTFSGAPVTAFGGNLYMTDIGFGPVSGGMTVELNDGTSVELDSPYVDSFTGFTSDVPITSVTLTPESGVEGLYITVDNILVGAAVPEPSSLALLGLGVLAALRRR